MLRQLVLAIFADEASADAAADRLNRWAGQEAVETLIDTHHIQAMGVLVLDESGKLKTEKLGPRSMGTGAGIGAILAMLTPIGMAVGIIGGGILGALHHRSLFTSKDDQERLGRELQGARLDDSAVAEVDAASMTTPADPSAKTPA